MKNSIKRLGIVLIALITALTMIVSTSAATLTVKRTDGTVKDSSVFSAYRVLTWDAREGSSVYTNIKNEAAFDAFFGDAAYGSYDLEKITALSAEEMASLTTALQHYVSDHGVEVTATSEDGVFTNLDNGYYLIIETSTSSESATVASKAMLVSVPSYDSAAGEWTSDIVVVAKDSKVTDDKKIVENGESVDANVASVGDEIAFNYTSDIPKYDAASTNIVYYITDTFSRGLTFNRASLKVTADGINLTENVNYTVATAEGENGATVLTINFDYETIKTYSSVLAEYTATLNENAVIGNSGNVNSANLTYTRNPDSVTTGKPGDTTTTPDKKTITYTGEIALTKSDAEGNPLAGVEFEIYSDAECTVPAKCYEVEITTIYNDDNTVKETVKTLKPISGSAVSDENGVVRFVGLIDGTYYIKETKALDNYNLLTDVIEVVVSVDNVPDVVVTGDEQVTWSASAVLGDETLTVDSSSGVISFSVINTQGVVFPGTGGVGTAVFTVSGLTLLAAAVILFTFYRRKAASK